MVSTEGEGPKSAYTVSESDQLLELWLQFIVSKDMNMKSFFAEENGRLQHDDCLIQTISTCNNRQMTLQC